MNKIEKFLTKLTQDTELYQENIELMCFAIKTNDIDMVKILGLSGLDVRHKNDYFLYLATFFKNKELQEYFLELGLEPDMTKSRLAVADPEGLEQLYKLKREKFILDFAYELDGSLSPKDTYSIKKKI